jgi:hypothetical protein
MSAIDKYEIRVRDMEASWANDGIPYKGVDPKKGMVAILCMVASIVATYALGQSGNTEWGLVSTFHLVLGIIILALCLHDHIKYAKMLRKELIESYKREDV